MILRVAAVALGYVLYLGLENRSLVGAVLVWAGTVLCGWALIDRYTTRRSERSGFVQTGSSLLGLGLLVIGAALALS
jgi:hypothetical protein